MSKSKSNRIKASLFYAPALVLLIWVPFILSAHTLKDRYLENQLECKEKHFSDVATMGKQHVLDCLGKMTEVVNGAGLTLSFVGTDKQSAKELFGRLNKSSEANSGLIYARDGSLIYGDEEYGSLFYETAREARSSGGSSVSELVECDDGEKRLAIASPFMTQDGTTGVVALVFSQSSLFNMLENLNLSDEGNLCVFGSDGSLILCRRSEQQWLSEKQFTIDKTGSLKEQMFTASETKDGKQYTAYSKPVGINDWFVIFAAPNIQDNHELRTAVASVHVFGGATVLLILVLVILNIRRGATTLSQIELFKKKFRIATNQSARAAFQYDRRTDRLSLISDCEHIKLPKPYISLSELSNLVHPADRGAYMQSVAELRGEGTTSKTVRVFNFCGKEVYKWYRVTATLLTNNGEGKAITIGTVEDIDERENERLLLHEKATTDSLTGLWNRAEIETVINERLSKLDENEHSVFAILDLDDFKDINDDFGHDCGDKALARFAEILRATFRFGDVLGRLGGDEFVVYMTLTAEKEIVERRLRELIENMLSGNICNNIDAPKISCSIGCCIAAKGDTFESVYKRADDALYESKTRGKQQFTIVD
ncbi:MAG: GGDEF domain-containing protein [Oscillospiraceae bacterium]|nr:GGDEF domain-containing protein [Oscillospiraceae bacterium]